MHGFISVSYTHLPAENIPLYHEIISKKGLILSEYPLEEKAKSKNFLERKMCIRDSYNSSNKY